ncbi:MAG TPA: YqhG family protein [Pseudogracilibacillus sp.]|nr:YqhG family protein [Pseudogracilibacillus sp.]
MTRLFHMHAFLKDFFQENNCAIKKDTGNSLNVQLTKAMDKAILNRPFYWHYTELMKQEGTPKEITLQTTYTKEKKLDWITVASPTFDRIISFLKEKNRYIHLYESIETSEKTLMQPWLLVNFSLLYEGIQKREEIISIGLNLMNGAYQRNMMETLEHLEFTHAISSYCYTTSPLIRIQSGYKRIEKLLDDHVAAQQHDWAIEAYEEMIAQKEMVHYFYENNENNEAKVKALDEITQLFQPTITYDVINGGMIYLQTSYMEQKEKPLQ